MSDLPAYAVAADESLPDYARVPVAAHTRKPRALSDKEIRGRVLKTGISARTGIPEGVIETGVNLLPAIGSMIPNPGGPALGAGVGALARQGAADVLGMGESRPISGALTGVKPGTLLSNVLDIAEQAGLGKAGEFIGPGVKIGGKTIIPGLETIGRGMTRVSMNLTPEATQTAIKAGFAATRRHLDKLMGRIGRISERQLQVLQQTPPTNVFQTRDLASYLDRTLIQPAKRGAKSQETIAKLEKWTNEMIESHPTGQLTAPEVHVMAQLSRQEAAPVIEKGAKGIQVTARDPLEQKWFKATVDWANDQLAGPKINGFRTGAGANLPRPIAAQYARLNRVQSKLIDLANRARPIIQAGEKGGAGKTLVRSVNKYTAGVVGLGALGGFGAGYALPGNTWADRTTHGLMGSVALGMAASPANLSRLSLMISNPQVAQFLAMLQQTAAAGGTAPRPTQVPGGPPVAP
jgi:hypothetical protein